MRALVLGLLRLCFRIFFRRVEVVGADQLPREGGLVYAANHPNGLIDPLFLLVLPPEPASFLAKEPLFRLPVVGALVKAMQCLPVYRARDGHDTAANRRTLAAARARLEAGGAIGIFPEGTSHSDPALKPFKTGAARIALGAAAGSEAPVHVVPCGLNYAAKATFRSHAALVYGAPIPVPRVAVDEAGEPPREQAAALTERIRQGLDEVVVQAESPELLALVDAATRLFAGVRRERGEPMPSLGAGEQAGEVARGFRLQRHMLQRYAEVRVRRPAEVDAIAARLVALESALLPLGLRLEDAREDQTARGAALVALQQTLWAAIVTPFALLGIVLHYPLYRLVGWLALRTAGEELDEVSTLKLLIGMLGFPLQWLLMAVAAGFVWSLSAAIAVAALGPALAWAALRWSEWLDRALGRLRLERGAEGLWRERDALYEELLALEAEA